LLGILLSGCGTGKTSEPITLTIWHVYGEQSDSPLNDMIEEFNRTVGLEKGITIKVTKVSNTNTLHEAVLASAKGEPGTEPLPDLFVAYPKTVLSMENRDQLVDFRELFSQEEIDRFIPAFVEEGMIDGELKVLPFAKSTEVLFVNKTLFDRFAQKSGVTIEDLSTWEGLFDVAMKYHAQTGKTFFADDYYFDYFQVGVHSMGGNFFLNEGDGINFDEKFETAWKPLAKAASQGAVWLGSGYATEALRTSDAIVSVASSAGVLYYEDIVTYPDNTSEPIELIAYPCPVFESGSKSVMQRGAGICLVKSTEQRQQAAATFLKWTLEPEHNVDFVTQCGYMPVTEEAFVNYLPQAMEALENPKYKSVYEAYLETQDNYEFYTAPQYSSYLDLETRFENNMRQELTESNVLFENMVGSSQGKTSDSEEDSLKWEQLLQQYSKDALQAVRQAME